MAQSSTPSKSEAGESHGPAATTKADEEGKTPKVTSVVPAIFVPLDRDLATQDFRPPRDRIERAKRVLESIKFHRAGVREGILHLAEMERKRILRENADWEAEHGVPETTPGLPPDEVDLMLRNMKAPAQPGVSYNLNVAAEEVKPYFHADVDRPDRADTVRQLQRVMEDGVNHLGGYVHHIEAVKKRWMETLEKEERIMEEKFGPDPTAKTAAPTAPMAPMETGDADGDVVMR